MTSEVRPLIQVEMAAFEAARNGGDAVLAWRSLERAHVLSQPYLTLRLSNHWAMLEFATSQRDVKELIGQIMRLALAPLGALVGRIPVGNTGRSNVSAFQPLPIPADLRDALDKGER